ncbi:cobalamin biosynthesis protein CobG [Primorskyibacter sp. S187A]|uniref:cobalamin biosynthesis protein CobG n=1 Tax=Primorskyibacter sp. S187A TaxID=3415130 RepID=UPI003C7DB206
MSQTAQKAPIVRGWCPGAYRPMMSGDGLVVRVRAVLGELRAEQVLGLAGIADRFGNGTLDLTSRANVQIRGVAEGDHPAVITALGDLGVLDADPALEARRNLVVAHDWTHGDLTHRLGSALLARLADLPVLPAKMGIALDTGAQAHLGTMSADVRFERSASGRLILRADGAALGRTVAEGEAMDALVALLEWFVQTGGSEAGRMARHLKTQPLPAAWQEIAPRPQSGPPTPGADTYGAPFGAVEAKALCRLIEKSGARALRVLPGRLFRLVGGCAVETPDFVTQPDDPLLAAHACPGAPFCPQAQGETRDLARRLAAHASGLHVSGCAKGCALPGPARWTLVAREGAFDLVQNGAPWDEPFAFGLTEDDILDRITP